MNPFRSGVLPRLAAFLPATLFAIAPLSSEELASSPVELRRLAELTGIWRVEGRVRASADRPWIEVAGTAQAETIRGGRFIVRTLQLAPAGETSPAIERSSLFGFDERGDRLRRLSTGYGRTAVVVEDGKADGDRLIFSASEASAGTPARRSVIEQAGAETLKETTYSVGSGGSERLVESLALVRTESKAAILPLVARNSAGMELCRIDPGEFVMGSAESEKGREDDESPQRTVRITRAFYLGGTEVTQAQWADVMETRPWEDNKNIEKGETLPAVLIRWSDAVQFCRKLSEREGKTYRLPTEAEWEYACRAGAATEFYWGVGFDPEFAWSSKNAKGLQPVATRWPNARGLFDMGGNVWEWCRDWHGPYDADGGEDPVGPASGERRVIRSGSYSNSMWDCRSGERGAVPPDVSFGASGFRVLLEIPSPKSR